LAHRSDVAAPQQLKNVMRLHAFGLLLNETKRGQFHVIVFFTTSPTDLHEIVVMNLWFISQLVLRVSTASIASTNATVVGTQRATRRQVRACVQVDEKEKTARRVSI
jgi:hypothetical protein